MIGINLGQEMLLTDVEKKNSPRANKYEWF